MTITNQTLDNYSPRTRAWVLLSEVSYRSENPVVTMGVTEPSRPDTWPQRLPQMWVDDKENSERRTEDSDRHTRRTSYWPGKIGEDSTGDTSKEPPCTVWPRRHRRTTGSLTLSSDPRPTFRRNVTDGTEEEEGTQVWGRESWVLRVLKGLKGHVEDPLTLVTLPQKQGTQLL